MKRFLYALTGAALVVCLALATIALANGNDAVQCSSSSPTAIPIPSGGRVRAIQLQNLGPNAIWVGFTTGKTTATAGMKVAANGGVQVFQMSSTGASLYCLADSATQTSPNDTRWAQLTTDTRQ